MTHNHSDNHSECVASFRARDMCRSLRRVMRAAERERVTGTGLHVTARCGAYVCVLPGGRHAEIVATDGHRMAIDVVPLSATGRGECVLPAVLARQILAMRPAAASDVLFVRRERESDTVRVIVGDSTWSAAAVPAREYPSYRRVIDRIHARTTHTATVPAEAFRAAVRAAAAAANGQYRVIYIVLSGDSIQVRPEIVQPMGGVSAGVPVAVPVSGASARGASVTFRLQSRYLLDGIAVVGGRGSTITLSWSDPYDAVRLNAGVREYVVMPMMSPDGTRPRARRVQA